MGRGLVRSALRHRGIVTATLLAALLVNLLIIGRLQPPDATRGDLPLAARCQGGGPGCAEQPLIPPPVGGLPSFDVPPAPIFGRMVAVAPTVPAALRERPPLTPERPPEAGSFA